MSVCNEGWETVTGECPALQWTGYDRAFDECGFGVYTYLEEERYGWPVINKMPDSCPHSAALRAVAEDPTLVLVALEEEDAHWWMNHARGEA